MADITITVANDVGQEWTLTGPGGEVASTIGPAVVENVADGSYTLEAKPLDGYALPSPRFQTVAVTGTGAFAVPTYSATTNNVTAIWANDGLDKVTRRDLRGGQAAQSNHAWDGSDINIRGARNEMVSFSVYLEAEVAKAENVAVTMSNITGAVTLTSGNRSAAQVYDWTLTNIELFYARYIAIKGLSYVSYSDGASYDERHAPERFRRPYTGDGDYRPNGLAVPGTTWEDRPDHDKEYPDALVPIEALTNKQFDIPAGTVQEIVVDVYIPKTATAGAYTGTLSVVEDGGAPTNVTVNLAVDNIDLPDVPHVKTVTHFTDYDVNRRHYGTNYPNDDIPNEVYDATNSRITRDNYFKVLHRHKLSMIGDERGDRGGGDYDYGDIPPWWPDRLSGALFTAGNGYDGPGVNTGNGIYCVGMYADWRYAWSTDQTYGKPTASDLQTYCDPWVTWFEANFPSVPYFLYLGDEVAEGVANPTSDVPFRGDLEAWAQDIQGNPVPGNRMKTFTTVPWDVALDPTDGIGMPSVDHFGHPVLWRDETAAQATLTTLQGDADRFAIFYNGQRPLTGSWATEDEGVSPVTLPWIQYKFGIDWFFYWQTTHFTNWEQQPPAGGANTDFFRGAKTYGNLEGFDEIEGETGFRHSNGDGVLMYPGTDLYHKSNSYDLDGPLHSIRLKALRRGVQDADYLALAGAVNQGSTDAVVTSVIPRVLFDFQAGDPGDTPAFGDKGYGHYPPSWPTDPDTWQAARASLVAIIES